MDDWEKSFSKIGDTDKSKPVAIPRPAVSTNRPIQSVPPAHQSAPVKPVVPQILPSNPIPLMPTTVSPTKSSAPLVYFALAMLYFVSPVDLIPDFLAGVGQGDDFSLLLWAGMNLWQKNYMDPQDPARKLLKFGKILVAFVGIILVLIAFLVLGALALILKYLFS